MKWPSVKQLRSPPLLGRKRRRLPAGAGGDGAGAAAVAASPQAPEGQQQQGAVASAARQLQERWRQRKSSGQARGDATTAAPSPVSVAEEPTTQPPEQKAARPPRGTAAAAADSGGGSTGPAAAAAEAEAGQDEAEDGGGVDGDGCRAGETGDHRGLARWLLFGYLTMLVLSFALTLLSDAVRLLLPALLRLSCALQVAATLFFLLVVPITHMSGGLFYRKQWRFFQPFKGGLSFIVFQALSWTFYAVCLALSLANLAFFSSLAHRAVGVVTSFGVCGVLSQLFMVTSLLVFERRQQQQQHKAPAGTPEGNATGDHATAAPPSWLRPAVRAVKEALYLDVFLHHNLALAVVAVALAVLAEVLYYRAEGLGDGDGDGDGAADPRMGLARAAGGLSLLLFAVVSFGTYGVGGRLHADKQDSSSKQSQSRPASPALPGAGVEQQPRGGDGEQEQEQEQAEEKRSAPGATTPPGPGQRRAVAAAAAAGAGERSGWRFWQPFLGGARFVALQALSWTLFTLSLLCQLAFVVSMHVVGFEMFVGAAVAAGALFALSMLLMVCSFHVYLPGPLLEDEQEDEGKRPAAAAAEGKKQQQQQQPPPLKHRGARKRRHWRVGLRAVRFGDEAEGLEQLRRLLTITLLSNMQYLPFLLPVLPFLAVCPAAADAYRHWLGVFVCLTAAVVAHAYAATQVAKRRGLTPAQHALHLHGPPLLVYGAEAAVAARLWLRGGPEGPVWAALAGAHLGYVLLTHRNRPAVTGCRYLGERLEFWPGGPSLYAVLDGVERYFQGKLVWTDGGAPPGIGGTGGKGTTPHIFAFHPHGIQPFTVFWIQLSRAWRAAMPGKRFCVMTASVMHYVPLMRDLLQWLGGREVSREAIHRALDEGESVLLVPGGQHEMVESQSGAGETRVVTKHVGFVRIALQRGVPLVPVLSLGEVEVMDFVRVPTLQRFFIQRIGIPVPFFPYGLFGLPLPRPEPITVLFGRPIPVGPPRPHPTPAEVEAVAARYWASLQELFEAHKHHHPNAVAEGHRLVLV